MNNVQKIRNKLGMSIHELSEKSGVSVGMLRKIETNTSHTIIPKGQRIADALDADFNEVWIVK